MQLRGVTLLLIIVTLATSAYSVPIIQCKPELVVYWFYNQESNSSEFVEKNEALTNTALLFDFGFIKLSQTDLRNQVLYRQSSITRNNDDWSDLTVRYESTVKQEISKSSLIVSDPMCINSRFMRANVIETAAISYSNSFYRCECLSPVFDHHNFILTK